MITIDEMEAMLEEIAEELPQEFYKDLNGGILLLPELKISPGAVDGDLYTLGEYRYCCAMGRYIVIYYGSFRKLFGHYPAPKIKKQLRETLYHEFTHHMESLAGERGLEIQDEEDNERYLAGKGGYRSPKIKGFRDSTDEEW